MRFLITATITVCLTAPLGGCLIPVPVPHKAHTPERFGTRAEPDRDELAETLAADPTREEVLKALGEPDKSWGGAESDRYFLYITDTAQGFVGPLGPMILGLDVGFHTGDKYLFLFEFDEQHRVERQGVERMALSAGEDSVFSRADAWAAGQVRPNPTYATVTTD